MEERCFLSPKRKEGIDKLASTISISNALSYIKIRYLSEGPANYVLIRDIYNYTSFFNKEYESIFDLERFLGALYIILQQHNKQNKQREILEEILKYKYLEDKRISELYNSIFNIVDIKEFNCEEKRRIEAISIFFLWWSINFQAKLTNKGDKEFCAYLTTNQHRHFQFWFIEISYHKLKEEKSKLYLERDTSNHTLLVNPKFSLREQLSQWYSETNIIDTKQLSVYCKNILKNRKVIKIAERLLSDVKDMNIRIIIKVIWDSFEEEDYVRKILTDICLVYMISSYGQQFATRRETKWAENDEIWWPPIEKNKKKKTNVKEKVKWIIEKILLVLTAPFSIVFFGGLFLGGILFSILFIVSIILAPILFGVNGEWLFDNGWPAISDLGNIWISNWEWAGWWNFLILIPLWVIVSHIAREVKGKEKKERNILAPCIAFIVMLWYWPLLLKLSLMILVMIVSLLSIFEVFMDLGKPIGY